MVNGLFQILHFAEAVLAVFPQKRHSLLQVFTDVGGHGADHDAALLDGDGRVGEEALVQQVPVAVFCLRLGGGLVLHDEAGKLSEQADGRGKNHDRHQAKDGVERRDAHGAHHRVHK